MGRPVSKPAAITPELIRHLRNRAARRKEGGYRDVPVAVPVLERLVELAAKEIARANH